MTPDPTPGRAAAVPAATVFTGPAAPYAGGDPYADHRAPDPATLPFTRLPDLADRRLGGSVTAASDEFFAERENLLNPEPARFDPAAFGHKGKVMDGWETRRRRGVHPDHPHPTADEHDWALIRLGVPGLLHGLVVDTAHFRGNHPHAVRIEGTRVPGTPGPETLFAPATAWTELVPRTEVGGHAAHAFPLSGAASGRFTHLRLSQYPDGGIARLRAHGEPLADLDWLAALGTFDLVALAHGGLVEDASDRFYSPPIHTILPGRPRTMDEGWETRRRRDAGHDWLRYRLATEGVVRAVEIDTGCYRGNAPGWAELALANAENGAGHGPGAGDGLAPGPGEWRLALPRTRLLPDTVHRFVLPEDTPPATHARLDVFPDGGVARLRLHGSPTEPGWRRLRERHHRTAPRPD
ncbi:allantoicase [Streptomyces sp. 3MP-14]|uniref:Probable allantoicase n=1 Tax=Streptomyces mimosae TaxID=2586635 RepID=A0A5N6AIE0_9ACTN|nr:MULTISPECIES: allantoicase [Streptomyces]KAB8167776.1 allantoicase [Streptomyces mimosae]KAB8177576.1 allantoicase [Streptomyces sp. 3MP-14]